MKNSYLLKSFFFCVVTFLNFGVGRCEQLANKPTVELKATYIQGRVFMQNEEGGPFTLKPGTYKGSKSAGILTFNHGQAVCSLGENEELRLKEETLVTIKASDSFVVRKGTAGFRLKNGKVVTRHLKVLLSDATIVVKVNPIITRICVIKGTAKVQKALNDEIELKKGFEVAASILKLSKAYKRTAELRFTWYWTVPEKEPSFQLDFLK